MRLQHTNEKSSQMDIRFLLKDEVFVDFFNTFLSLPVCGQTPLFLLSENKWLMCPNPHLAQISTGGFLKWLETHRLVFFKRTEIYHNFTLCKEILDFVASASTDELKWTLADQWLLRRCLGSVRGIQRFHSFLKGSAGEELFLFCVRVSMLLSMNLEDELRTFNQQSYLTMMRLCHLTEGSAVLSLCHLSTDDITELLSNESARKHMLSEMRLKALRQLQSYWLPQFLHSCKSWMWSLPECGPIVMEYMSLSSPSPRGQSPSPCEHDKCHNITTLSPAESYCSRHTKRRLWSLQQPIRGSVPRMRPQSMCLWLPSEWTNTTHPQQDLCRNLVTLPSQTNLTVQERNAIVHHTYADTPVCQFSCCVNLHPPPSDLQRYLLPALSAEGRAGGPFRSFLRAGGLRPQLQMLALFQDLEFLLQMILKAQGEDPVYAQRQIVAQRIIETYLRETMPGYVPLDSNTRHHLRSLLPSSTAVPWIYMAKYEICKKLCDVYDSFLDTEDNTLLSELSSHGEETDDGGQLLFSGFRTETEAHLTQMEAWLLSERCCSHGNPEVLSRENWILVAQQDLQRGGSLLFHRIDPDLKNLMLATKKMIDNKRPLTKGRPVLKPVDLTKTVKQEILPRPSTRPRTFEDVFATPHNIEDFKNFLQSHNSEEPLMFLQESETLRTIKPKQQKAKISAIVDKFFRVENPMASLQCTADIINSVSQMSDVPLEVIFTVQHLVSKSLEATWFKRYQETFSAPCTTSSDVNLRAALLMEKMKKNVWQVFNNYIHAVSKFLVSTRDRETRAEFEWYLLHNYEQFSESCEVKSWAQQNMDSSDDGEPFKPKFRSVINKPIIVNFLPYDFSFYLECERFRHLADVGVIMASAGMYSETDYMMLQNKAQLIIDIFLKCDTFPNLRINITEARRDGILQRFGCGKVDRTLFYPAMMDVIPVLIYCWKKFCCVKLVRSMLNDQRMNDQVVFCPFEKQCPVTILHQKIKTIRSDEVKEPTLHFSAQHGLMLLLPKSQDNHTDAISQPPSAKCPS